MFEFAANLCSGIQLRNVKILLNTMQMQVLPPNPLLVSLVMALKCCRAYVNGRGREGQSRGGGSVGNSTSVH